MPAPRLPHVPRAPHVPRLPHLAHCLGIRHRKGAPNGSRQLKAILLALFVLAFLATVTAGCGSDAETSTTASSSTTAIATSSSSTSEEGTTSTAATTTSSTSGPSTTGPSTTSTSLTTTTTGSTTTTSGPTSTTSSSTTSTTIQRCSAQGMSPLVPQMNLPGPVAATREEIFRAVMTCDFAELEQLASTGSNPFTFSFGGDTGGPAQFWRSRENAGEPVLATLATILNMPYGVRQGQYVWPFAHALNFEKLSPQQLALLRVYFTEEQIDDWRSFGGYTGYRVGISASGEWMFYVAGD